MRLLLLVAFCCFPFASQAQESTVKKTITMKEYILKLERRITMLEKRLDHYQQVEQLPTPAPTMEVMIPQVQRTYPGPSVLIDPPRRSFSPQLFEPRLVPQGSFLPLNGCSTGQCY